MRMSVKGGNTATSTEPSSCLASLSVQWSFWTNATACRWSRFIFQLPARSGVRPVTAIRGPPVREVSCPRGTRGSRRRRSRCVRTASSENPSWRTAAAESPPPTTDRPSTSVSACATAFVPAANARHLEHAHGAVPEDRLAGAHDVGEERRGLGPDVQAQPEGAERRVFDACTRASRHARRPPRTTPRRPRRPGARTRRPAPRPWRCSPSRCRAGPVRGGLLRPCGPGRRGRCTSCRRRRGSCRPAAGGAR